MAKTAVGVWDEGQWRRLLRIASAELTLYTVGRMVANGGKLGGGEALSGGLAVITILNAI